MSDLSRQSAHFPLLVLVCSSLLWGCSSFDSASNKIVSVITPYKMDVVQGNVVTKEQVAALKPGMARSQVRDVLGTALLTSVFHADRWDYVFTLKSQTATPQSRKVTVFFKNDAMEKVVAEDLPTEAEFVATLKSMPVSGSLPPMEATPESLRAFPVAPKPVAAVGSTAPIPANYPPLEPTGK
jgi:outer membrane protein assembly factor BamE